MSAAEPAGAPLHAGSRPGCDPDGARCGESVPAGWARPTAWCWLALVLLVALGLRLWGVKQGLPYIYNIDEAGHFVPKAVAMSAEGLNPHYFVNPPALTYVLHLVFTVWFGGAHGVTHEYALRPGEVFLVARVTVALLGTAAVWVLYLLGARLFDRRTGLLAAAIEAVAFLPVSYGHFALNDAVTLLPLTLSLLGSAGVMRFGRRRDYALAGIGLGLACASKYTAGIAIVPLAAAAAAHYLDSIDGTATQTGSPPAGRGVVIGIALAGACALASFLIANPYALLDFQRFHSELIHQSSLADEAQGKLGAPKESGLLYYLWSFTWGLGWLPLLAALAGAIAIWWRSARIGWLLVPAAILFLAFMGLQDRYFGRWLLPIFPIACVLAAYFAVLLTRAMTERTPLPARGGVIAGALVVLLLLAQGLVYGVHNDLVLSRTDTRNLTRAWIVAHVPRGAKIVLEPVVLDSWVEEGHGSAAKRWTKYGALTSVISPDGRLAPQVPHAVALEDYETTLAPSLIGWYESQGYCWVVTGSTEFGRAFADPALAPLAVAYYRALAAQSEVAYHVSPYESGATPPAFNFDWTFDYYPLSYRLPGPAMTVYRLRGGRCARGA
ncbi:MAG TPA: glycosyltransferase family 39 protein [Solirubrobacteraceae bacterium]|jgi:4-amino-4-deoxy-L-arabinose transferase-like glycosyltransferase|nr:glycosyltransferase family 39 protein [Solirubrobacteraceae bacterium]